MRAGGARPQTIIDVGAALGDWSREAARVFPDARFVLVEPVREFDPALDAAAAAIGRATVVRAAAGRVVGEGTLHVHPDLVGSSLFREREGEHVDGEPRNVPMTTVDTLVEQHELEPPFLLKVDVQGAEAAVLEGATTAFEDMVGVICEVSFFDFFVGGVPFDALVAGMRARDFCVYDISNLARRPLDGALGQADVAFVPVNSPLRSEHVYALPRQRAAQTAEFARAVQRRIQRASGAK
jgi:FkbM family methyltransferase